MDDLKRENFELRRSLLEQEEKEWDSTVKQRPQLMSTETKKAMQQAVVQSYQNAFKTHEACLTVLDNFGHIEHYGKGYMIHMKGCSAD